MTARHRLLLLVLALVGFGFASTSAWVHHQLLTDPTYSSFCDVNARFNCSQLYMSRFGSVGGVSTALFGMFWFVLVGLMAWSSQPRTDAKAAPDATATYLFALSTVGLAVVLYLGGWASFVVLKTFCLLCMGTYAAVIGIFIVSGAASSVPVQTLPGRFMSDVKWVASTPAMLTVALLFVAGAATVVAFFPKEAVARNADPMAAIQPKPDAGSQAAPTPAAPAATQASQATTTPPAPQDPKTSFLQAWDAAPRVNLGIPADGAKVVVVKFNDYLCPACKETFLSYKPILDRLAKEMPGAVKYVTKDYPLETECNFAIGRTLPGHEPACEAAAAVRMARDVKKDVELELWLFSNQQGMTVEKVKQGLANIAGVKNFDQQYGTKLAETRQDVSDGSALQIESTPTYFVNGVRIARSILPAEWFDVALQHEIKKAGGPAPR